jgi:hypothetical protein
VVARVTKGSSAAVGVFGGAGGFEAALLDAAQRLMAALSASAAATYFFMPADSATHEAIPPRPGEENDVVNADLPAENLEALKSWPVTIVAGFLVLQGLSAGYSALADVGLFGYPRGSSTSVAFAAIYAIVSVALIVAGAGLLVRNKACLTIATILAALFLMSAGSDAAGAFFGQSATPMGDLVAILFVIVGWLQYAILRSRATIALFSRSS